MHATSYPLILTAIDGLPYRSLKLIQTEERVDLNITESQTVSIRPADLEVSWSVGGKAWADVIDFALFLAKL